MWPGFLLPSQLRQTCIQITYIPSRTVSCLFIILCHRVYRSVPCHAGLTLVRQLSHIVGDTELVLKVRIADQSHTDFIEVELDMEGRTMDSLLNLLCTELQLSKDSIAKIRKLPNTILRKDKDVKRLIDFQEIEVVQVHND